MSSIVWPGSGSAERDQIDRMAALHRDADLARDTRGGNTGARAGARLDDHVGSLGRVDREPLRRLEAEQHVVDRTREIAAVHHQLVVERQGRRLPLTAELDHLVAALAHRIPEQDRPLCRVDPVGRPEVP
jgi:hypothetical protein